MKVSKKIPRNGISERLNLVLQIRGMRQLDVANLTEISRPTITCYFLGTRIPPDTSLIKICEILNCSPEFIKYSKGSCADKFDRKKYFVDNFITAFIDMDTTFEFNKVSEGRLMVKMVLSRKETDNLTKIFSNSA